MPQNFDVRDGEVIELSCEARGNPQPTISWKHDGRPVIVNGRNSIRITPSGTLFIDRPDRTHNGAFECTAQNTHGVNKTTARVRVRGTKKPSNRTIM